MFAVLHVPSFALLAVLRAEPGLAGQPVVLNRMDQPAVALCNRTAHLAGIRPDDVARTLDAREAVLAEP